MLIPLSKIEVGGKSWNDRQPRQFDVTYQATINKYLRNRKC
ncbi:hypothetical protein ACFOG5_09740 [Pedobacter fastidiosus]